MITKRGRSPGDGSPGEHRHRALHHSLRMYGRTDAKSASFVALPRKHSPSAAQVGPSALLAFRELEARRDGGGGCRAPGAGLSPPGATAWTIMRKRGKSPRGPQGRLTLPRTVQARTDGRRKC